MELKGQRRVPIDRESAWKALNDPAILKAAIAGCESMEKTGDNEYRATVTAALGSVRGRFDCRLTVDGVLAPEHYAVRLEGDGGAAGFAKGTANVVLVPDGNGTVIEYMTTVQLGGTLAQVESRIVESAALKLADDFFAAFERQVAPNEGTPAPAELPRAKVPPARVVAIAAILATLVASIAYTVR